MAVTGDKQLPRGDEDGTGPGVGSGGRAGEVEMGCVLILSETFYCKGSRETSGH